MSLSHYNAPDGSYTQTIPPGTAAFRKETGAFFNFRTEVIRDASRCRQQRSEHCEAAAVDEFPGNRAFFDWCVKVADPLGIQSVIYNRRVIGFGNPTERHYTGADPHTGHVHVGLNRWARRNLTEAMVRALLPGGQEDDLTPEQDQRLKDVEAALAQLTLVVTALAAVVGKPYYDGQSVLKALTKKGNDGVYRDQLDVIEALVTPHQP